MKTRADYRVRMRVDFHVDVLAESLADAMLSAERITSVVFQESFGRAEDVVTEATGVRALPTPRKQPV